MKGRWNERFRVVNHVAKIIAALQVMARINLCRRARKRKVEIMSAFTRNSHFLARGAREAWPDDYDAIYGQSFADEAATIPNWEVAAEPSFVFSCFLFNTGSSVNPMWVGGHYYTR